MKIKKLVNIIDIVDEETRASFYKIQKPMFVANNRVPDDLNMITFGQLCRLYEMDNDKSMLIIPCRELFGMKDREILNCEHDQVIGLLNFCISEIQRISKMFEQTRIEPTTEEVRAGIELLNFGMFGIADWYALRQGIKDQNDVYKIGWIRIWQCLKMETEKSKYERRLREILNNKK